MKIPGLLGEWGSVGKKYNYDKNKTQCGVCGGLGIPWRGWFSCEDCTAKSVIKTGETFILVKSSVRRD